MNNAGLIAYFLASYSIGLASLVISLASYLKRRSKAARDFFLASLVLAIIASSSMVMNLVDAQAAGSLLTVLTLVNHVCAAALIVVLPLLIHSVYKTARSRSLNLAFLALACVTVVVAAILAIGGLANPGGRLVLGVKDLAILYAAVRILLYRRRRHDGALENVLHFIMIETLIIFPIIVVSELAPAVFRAVVPLESKGSVSLPLAYSLWSIAYLLSWFKGYVRPVAATDGSYRDFSAQFGLSPRESEVTRLLLGGQSYKEIMASLSISMPTVKSHIGSIYRKTGSNNKMQLSLQFSSLTHPKV
ncbi:MAG TPA: helix-turn-helix transcriptional regulator [Spirochaetia bacterium]|nr:helix-turn-helix transcriptional regulator [Spirochaetia bacterium]